MTTTQSVPLCHLHNYARSPDPSNPGNRANVLMLHGHGQSMDIFYHKTHFLQDALNMGGSQPSQSLPNLNVYYSEAPFEVNTGLGSKVWGYGLFDTQPVWGLEQSVGRVLRQLEQLNPVVGIIGFSTGATLAMIIASLLEKKDRCRLFGVNTTHPPLKFVVAYSGFMLGHPMYTELYEPAIRTPVLLYIGELDPMIPPATSYRLAERCSHAEIRTFWGTHYVPRHGKTTMVAINFVRRCVNGEIQTENADEAQAEDGWIDAFVNGSDAAAYR
ncbi:alpha/beta-hydrolase [Aspergillus sclerotiicarbonarius CBS 121057]|uniref:Alpha/beta-hydrolase n=1 Tax=Aspergillus sclerotiicarbonarius (strain CBS 121057 / IBT 28362) TaxID=1448318 RepID=A0A319E4J4_ASPSB|nr:alpha/beta-hydrolase [Aspergillus sclerotiicarbonarius CBS 121057]